MPSQTLGLPAVWAATSISVNDGPFPTGATTPACRITHAILLADRPDLIRRG